MNFARALLLVLSLSTGFTPTSWACSLLKPKTKVERTNCFSFSFRAPSLARTIEGHVILPAGYSERSPRYAYAIFLHGRSGTRDQIRDIGGVQVMEKIVNEGLTPYLIFSVSGGDHYWMNAAISNEKWGDLITKDLVNYIEKNFRVLSQNPKTRALFGISMGGAGTLQLGLNNPGLFSVAAAMSPVFRTEAEIWRPGSKDREPKEDYDSFGSGSQYEARSPRHLCEKNRRPNKSCLPFASFRLDMGESDPFLTEYKDTKKFIEELAATHPQFRIAIGRCNSPSQVCKSNEECYGHNYAYWSCILPNEMRWISARFNEALPREPAAKSKSEI